MIMDITFQATTTTAQPRHDVYKLLRTLNLTEEETDNLVSHVEKVVREELVKKLAETRLAALNNTRTSASHKSTKESTFTTKAVTEATTTPAEREVEERGESPVRPTKTDKDLLMLLPRKKVETEIKHHPPRLEDRIPEFDSPSRKRRKADVSIICIDLESETELTTSSQSSSELSTTQSSEPHSSQSSTDIPSQSSNKPSSLSEQPKAEESMTALNKSPSTKVFRSAKMLKNEANMSWTVEEVMKAYGSESKTETTPSTSASIIPAGRSAYFVRRYFSHLVHDSMVSHLLSRVIRLPMMRDVTYFD
ncbi:hypothetical protein COOONC_02489 [Cooperia oncophora]